MTKTSYDTKGWLWRLGLALFLDILDFTLGRIPILGTIFDGVLGIIGIMLWGKTGAFQFLEIFDFTDQIDAEIPTLFLSGLGKLIYEKYIR